jgi:hypothetical protein
MRFEARHIDSGRWGVYDGGVMGWRAVDLGEDEARQMAIDMDDRSRSRRQHGQQPAPSTIGYASGGSGGDGYVGQMGDRLGSKQEISGVRMAAEPSQSPRKTDSEHRRLIAPGRSGGGQQSAGSPSKIIKIDPASLRRRSEP